MIVSSLKMNKSRLRKKKRGTAALKSVRDELIVKIIIDSKQVRAEYLTMKPSIYPFLSMIQVFTYPHGIYSKIQYHLF